jgi:formylmethanofuran dehydrogenase subunit E
MSVVSKSELEAALLAEAPKQFMRYQKNRSKRLKGLPKWRRELEEADNRVTDAKVMADELKRQHDPELMRINSLLERKMPLSAGGLRCPKCHEGDRGNRMNGKPWCMACNVALESPFLVKKRLPNVKVLPKSKRLDVTFRGLDE